jgi:hypothetical protein
LDEEKLHQDFIELAKEKHKVEIHPLDWSFIAAY